MAILLSSHPAEDEAHFLFFRVRRMLESHGDVPERSHEPRGKIVRWKSLIGSKVFKKNVDKVIADLAQIGIPINDFK